MCIATSGLKSQNISLLQDVNFHRYSYFRTNIRLDHNQFSLPLAYLRFTYYLPKAYLTYTWCLPLAYLKVTWWSYLLYTCLIITLPFSYLTGKQKVNQV